MRGLAVPARVNISLSLFVCDSLVAEEQRSQLNTDIMLLL